MSAKVIKLQDNSNNTLLPVTDASLVQMTVGTETKSVQEVILEDEEVTAAGYNDLNNRITDIEGAGYITSASIPSLSYSSSGSGTVVTDISVDGHAITLIKGASPITEHSKDFGKVQSVTGQSGTDGGTSNTNTAWADAVKDTLQVRGGNKWITTGVTTNDTSETSNTDILNINHAINPSGSDKTATLSGSGTGTFGSTEYITGVSYNVDAAGHIASITATKSKLPTPSFTQSKDFGIITSATTAGGTDAGTVNQSSVNADSVKDTLTVKGGNKWITTGVTGTAAEGTVDNDTLLINHAINPSGNDKTATLTSGSNGTFGTTYYLTGVSYNVDAAGHIASITATKSLLPTPSFTESNDFGKITAGTNSTAYTTPTSNTSSATAETPGDTLTVTPSNYWIKVGASDTSNADVLNIGHALATNSTTPISKTLYGNESVVVTSYEFDAAGHRIKTNDTTYTLSLNAAYINLTYDGTTKSVQDVILEDEEVTATALNELNDRIGDVEESSHETNAYTASGLTDLSPAHGGNFTVIGNVEVNSYGHVSKLWTQKVTLPNVDESTHLQSSLVSFPTSNISSYTNLVDDLGEAWQSAQYNSGNDNTYLGTFDHDEDNDGAIDTLVQIKGNGPVWIEGKYNNGNLTVPTSININGSDNMYYYNIVAGNIINNGSESIKVSKRNEQIPVGTSVTIHYQNHIPSITYLNIPTNKNGTDYNIVTYCGTDGINDYHPYTNLFSAELGYCPSSELTVIYTLTHSTLHSETSSGKIYTNEWQVAGICGDVYKEFYKIPAADATTILTAAHGTVNNQTGLNTACENILTALQNGKQITWDYVDGSDTQRYIITRARYYNNSGENILIELDCDWGLHLKNRISLTKNNTTSNWSVTLFGEELRPTIQGTGSVLTDVNLLDGQYIISKGDPNIIKINNTSLSGIGNISSSQLLGQGYGVCDTSASTAAKTVSLAYYNLITDGIVAIRFSYGHTASSMSLNINTKGGKPALYNGANIGNGVINTEDIASFIYDGNYYRLISVSSAHNKGYGTCSVGETVQAKVVNDIPNFTLTAGTVVAVKFTYRCYVSNPTLNINSTGAKPIHFNGGNVSSTIIAAALIGAGDVVTFIYDGANYNIIANSTSIYRTVAYSVNDSTTAYMLGRTTSVDPYQKESLGYCPYIYFKGNTGEITATYFNENGTRLENKYATLSTLSSYAPLSTLTSYAPLASPNFTGTPTAPVPAMDTTNTAQIATTGFVRNWVDERTLLYKVVNATSGNTLLFTSTAPMESNKVYLVGSTSGDSFTFAQLNSLSIDTNGLNNDIKIAWSSSYVPLTADVTDAKVVPVYQIVFRCGSNGTSILIPNNVKWKDGAAPDTRNMINKLCELTIMNDIATINIVPA